MMHHPRQVMTYGGVGVGVDTRGDPVPVGVFKGSLAFIRFLGPSESPMFRGAAEEGRRELEVFYLASRA